MSHKRWTTHNTWTTAAVATHWADLAHGDNFAKRLQGGDDNLAVGDSFADKGDIHAQEEGPPHLMRTGGETDHTRGRVKEQSDPHNRGGVTRVCSR